MRLDDLYSYKSAETLNESPYSTKERAKDRMSSWNIFNKGEREQAKGSLEAGKQANELGMKFRRAAGAAGYKGKNTVPSKFLANFLAQNKLPNDGIENLGDLTPKDAESHILKAVRANAGRVSSTNDEPQVNQNNNTAPSQPEQQQNPTPGNKPVAQPTEPVYNTPSPKGKGASAIDQLDDAGRQALAAYLKNK